MRFAKRSIALACQNQLKLSMGPDQVQATLGSQSLILADFVQLGFH